MACVTVYNSVEDDKQEVYATFHNPAELAECKYARCVESMQKAGCSNKAINKVLVGLGKRLGQTE